MKLTSFIIDLDGTMYRGDTVIPEAPSFIHRLNENNIKYLFYTNCPKKSPQETLSKLRFMSIPAAQGSVINSGILAIEYIEQKYAKNNQIKINILGSEYMKKHASSLGMVVTADNPDCVLIAYSGSITMDEVNRACSQISRGASFFATNPDYSIPADEGFEPHTGAIIEIIKNITGAEPIIVGKPSNHTGVYFKSRFGCGANDICVIGDNLETDMKFARNCGFNSYLVLTGMTSKEYAKQKKEEYDCCFNDLDELYRFIQCGA